MTYNLFGSIHNRVDGKIEGVGMRSNNASISGIEIESNMMGELSKFKSAVLDIENKKKAFELVDMLKCIVKKLLSLGDT